MKNLKATPGQRTGRTSSESGHARMITKQVRRATCGHFGQASEFACRLGLVYRSGPQSIRHRGRRKHRLPRPLVGVSRVMILDGDLDRDLEAEALRDCSDSFGC
jgi:hypothetical protein